MSHLLLCETLEPYIMWL